MGLPESLGQAEQLLRAECDWVALPVSVGSLCESESLGELLLGEACLLPESAQGLAEKGFIL